MKFIRMGFVLAGAVVLGSAVFVSSTFAGTDNTQGLTVVRHPSAKTVKKTVNSRVQPTQQFNTVNHKVALIAPPKELAVSPSSQMVTSIAPIAPVNNTNHKTTKKTAAKVAPAKIAIADAKAPAQKTSVQSLYTLVRLLNFAPHPLNEELLKKEPLTLDGKNYWFALKYDEDWKVINDDEGYIKGISFEIDVMENNAKVRSLKTPKVAINTTKIKKGQILGVAEVAPYKFTISVEEFIKNKQGVSELVFKLDLVG